MKHYERVCAYVDLTAIHANMDRMKANIHPMSKMIGVIKTDGYGHGAVPIAKELEPLDYMFGFATATVEEALILRECGIWKPILILGYTFPYCYEALIRQKIRPTVFKYDMIQEMSKTAVELGQKIMVHIKVDTAMSRIGITPDDAGIAFIQATAALPGIEIEGIFTHFARADEADKTAVKNQLAIYQAFLERVERECGIRIPMKHCANSAGIIELQESNMNLVRAGIALYGLWPSSEVSQDIVALTPALSLKSHIVYIKTLPPDTPISYGGSYVTEKEMRVATIPIGYGDGYPRNLSNKGYVLIHGQKAPILGRVCMDQMMVDVTHIPQAKDYDEVTLIGSDGALTITMEELGELSGRFHYELACDLGKRVPRVYLRDGKEVLTRDYFSDYQ